MSEQEHKYHQGCYCNRCMIHRQQERIAQLESALRMTKCDCVHGDCRVCEAVEAALGYKAETEGNHGA